MAWRKPSTRPIWTSEPSTYEALEQLAKSFDTLGEIDDVLNEYHEDNSVWDDGTSHQKEEKVKGLKNEGWEVDLRPLQRSCDDILRHVNG